MLLNKSVMRHFGGLNCTNSQKEMEKNEQEWYLPSIKWGVQLVLNGTVNLAPLFL